MLPAWLTKLKDVKARSGQSKQQEPSATHKRWHNAATSLSKSLSLRRANSKGRDASIDREVMDGSSPTKDVGRLSSTGNGSDPSKSGHDSHELPCRGFLHPSSLKELVVADTDMEEFALLSETSSTFGSEMSSADSSVTSKCSSCEEGSQGGQIWGQHHSDYALVNLQKNSDRSPDVKVTAELKGGSSRAILTSRLSQESTGIQLNTSFEIKTAQQDAPFSSAISEKSGKATGFIPGNGNKISLDARKSGIPRDSSSVTNGNGSILQSRGYVCCGPSNNYANEEQMGDQKMPVLSNWSRNMEATSSCKSECREYKYRAFTSDYLSLPVDYYPLQKSRDAIDSLPRGLDVTDESTSCALQIRLGETSQSYAIKMQRKRQRGSSISAVLPPDLQGLVGDSVAFVKLSEDPYEDFKQSMYEMIMEKGLEESIDVEELLYCYLTLNSPEHHELIKEVFSDVWTSVLMPGR